MKFTDMLEQVVIYWYAKNQVNISVITDSTVF